MIFSYRPPLTPFLSPNTSKLDYLFILKQLLNFFSWRSNKRTLPITEAFIKKFFFDTYGVDNFYFFDSGRTALFAILQSLELQKGDEVALQAFTCVAIPNAIRAVGAVPHFVDIDDTYNLSVEKIREILDKPNSIKAVIVQHTFGFPANLPEIREICYKYKIFLIEDCAHVFDAKINNQTVGSFGDAVMFSFGRDKALSVVSGGIALVKDKKINQKIKGHWESLPYPQNKWILQRFLHPLIFLIAKRCYYWFYLGQIIIACAKSIHLIPKVLTRKEYGGKIDNRHYKLPSVCISWIALQIKQLSFFNNRRRATSKIYETKLRNCKKIYFPITPAGVEPIFLRYPLRVNEPKRLREYAKNYGIILGDWYNKVIAPQQVDLETVGYKIGSCPFAEKISSQIINLPTNYEISQRDAEFICKIIRKYYNESH